MGFIRERELVYRILCQEFSEFRFLSSGQIPFTVKKCCVFPNPALYFNQVPDRENTLQTLDQRLSESHILNLYSNRVSLFTPGIMFYSFIKVKEGLPKECFLLPLN